MVESILHDAKEEDKDEDDIVDDNDYSDDDEAYASWKLRELQ